MGRQNTTFSQLFLDFQSFRCVPRTLNYPYACDCDNITYMERCEWYYYASTSPALNKNNGPWKTIDPLIHITIEHFMRMTFSLVIYLLSLNSLKTAESIHALSRRSLHFADSNNYHEDKYQLEIRYM